MTWPFSNKRVNELLNENAKLERRTKAMAEFITGMVGERRALRLRLQAIAALETPRASHTVRKMAAIARNEPVRRPQPASAAVVAKTRALRAACGMPASEVLG